MGASPPRKEVFMKIVEIYIVKKDNYSLYVVRSTIGIGYIDTSKVTDFTDLTTATVDGTNSNKFEVYVNDYKLTNKTDYVINSVTKQIQFTTPLVTGDEIKIYDILDSVAKVITKNSYNKNALFTYFNTYQKFKYNQEYTFSLDVVGTNYTKTFLAQYDPFYSSIKNIRVDTGDLLDGVTDAQIAKVIYKWSREAYWTLDNDSRLDDIKDYQYVQNYVRYKTDIDLCYAIYLTISGKYGVIKKEIGNIQVQRDTKIPLIDKMIQRFKELLENNEALLKGSTAIAASFVKANDTSYTVSDRGVF